ncbi:MAG: AMP-binding protein, partial [Actinomycetota bacterium]
MREQDLLDWDWVREHRSTMWARMPAQAMARRAQSHPNDPVLGDGRTTLVADELAHRVAGVATQLLEEGTDRPVVVLVDWSLTSAIAILGVQWSGRCVIPLNSSDPKAWLSGILDRIGDCTIADATGVNSVLFEDRSIIDVSRVVPNWVDPVPVRGDSPSLVIFTSGSTGVPKGVIRLGWQDDVASMRIRRDFSNETRSAVFAPLHWIGGLNVLRSKLGDGYLCLVDPRSMSAAELIDIVRKERIEALHLTPSLAESLHRELSGAEGVETVTRVRFIGEEARWSSVRAARALGGERTVVCATLAASVSLGTIARIEIVPDEPLGTGRLPIGRSVGEHIRLEPLDEDSSTLSELTVHRWVSHGYWGDPQSTAKVFTHT